MSQPPAFRGALALCRIFVGFIFLLFGQYKLFRPDFAHGGLQYWLKGFSPFPFYQSFLAHWVLPHPIFWAYFVGAGEFAIGVSLITGLFVRAASVGGLVEMLNLLAASGYSPGPHAPLWRYFGANLEHICPALPLCSSSSDGRVRRGGSTPGEGRECSY